MAYTNIDDPSAHFQIALHSSANSATITNDGNSDLQPDFIWSKARGVGHNHGLYDSTRGVTKFLQSDTTSAEGTASAGFDLISFDTDGFSTGNNQFNLICGNTTYVAWQWKANGGTTVSNTDGDLRSVTVQANQDAGFSIVRFLGGTTPYTAGHGLGVAPDVIISKRLGATVGWYVYHKDVGAGKYLQINNANAAVTSATEAFTSAPTSTIFTGGTGIGGATDYYINYCFASKQGYSKFGSYIGNGESLNGPFVYTGFKPAWVMIKNTETTNRTWVVHDTKRRTFNPNGTILTASISSAEATGQAIDMLSNGFKVKPGALGSFGTSNINHSGQKMIYMAFAENPFTTSTGVPTTAR
jgi:hypothetical protein